MADTPLRTPMERAPTPELGTEGIPKERYTSAEFARLEWERMWTRVWLMAGRASDIPEPGDYASFEIGPESVLAVRDKVSTLVSMVLILALLLLPPMAVVVVRAST